MILVLDTNIYIRAVLSPQSYSGFILQCWQQGEVQLATSEDILTEIGRVLAYPHLQQHHRWSEAKIKRYLQALRLGMIFTPSITTVPPLKADPSDEKFLVCAVEAQAQALITDDAKHLLPLQMFQGIPIMTPERFVAQWRERNAA